MSFPGKEPYMAQLQYNEQGRLLFTEEMKKEYTLLMPQMLPVLEFNFHLLCHKRNCGIFNTTCFLSCLLHL